MTERTDSDVILEVVRGERPWRELATVGIRITFDGNATHAENQRKVVAVARPADVAKGLIAHEANPLELQEWARVMLAGVSFLDLDLEDQPDGDILLDALWNARFGRMVSDRAYQVAVRSARSSADTRQGEASEQGRNELPYQDPDEEGRV